MKKGFTLIELLSVIVILAIIALIATPIILNIINSAKINVNKMSAELYVDAVNNAISKEYLNEINYNISDGIYSVMNDGNVCIGNLTNNICTGEIIEVEINNKRPTEGLVKISNGTISQHYLLFSGEWITNMSSTMEECFETKQNSDGTLTISKYVCAPYVYNSGKKQNTSAINYITDVIIPEKINDKKVTAIANYAFYYNGITSVEMPDSLITIGAYSFGGNSLTDVTIPQNVTLIDRSAFRENKLKSIVIPSSVMTIGETSFYANQLESIEISNGVKTIGKNAFRENMIKSVVIPPSVVTMGDMAFNNNQLSDSEAFIYARNSDGSEDKTTLISYAGANRNNVVIPENVVTIAMGSFSGIELENVTFGNNVETIGFAAFEASSLTSIIIPESVQIIENYAFVSNKLTSVTIKGKSSTSDFTSYPSSSPFGWASGYSDANIIWEP